MIVFVVFYRFEQALPIEALLRFEIANDFLIKQIESLRDRVFLIVFDNVVRACPLHSWRTHVEAHSLGPVQLVPGMLPYALDVDALTRICHENPRNHVLGLVGEEVGRLILGIQNLFVKIRGPLVLEGKVPAEHRVQDDAATPQITHQAIVVFSSNHL